MALMPHNDINTSLYAADNPFKNVAKHGGKLPKAEYPES